MGRQAGIYGSRLTITNHGSVFRYTAEGSGVFEGNPIVQAGQIHANNFCGAGIATDGIRGDATKKAGINNLLTTKN